MDASRCLGWSLRSGRRDRNSLTIPIARRWVLNEAVEVAASIGSDRNYLTHLTHTVDHGPMEEELPATVRLAYDGLRLVV